MQSPELQTLNKLEQIKRTLVNQLQLEGDVKFSPENDTKGVLTLISEKLDSSLVEKTSIETAVPVALSMIQELIKQAPMKEDELETFFENFLNHDEELKEKVLLLIASTLQYKSFVEKTCVHYGLSMPNDTSRVLFEMDTPFTVFDLQEAEYYLSALLNVSLQEAKNRHPIRDLSYFRHITITDGLVEQVQAAKKGLTEDIIVAMTATQQAIETIINEYAYSETIEDLSVFQDIQEISAEWVRKSVGEFYFDSTVRTFFNSDKERCDMVSAYLNRLDILKQLLDSLIEKIALLQTAAFEATEYMGLDDIFHTIKETVCPLSNNIKSLQLKVEITVLTNKQKNLKHTGTTSEMISQVPGTLFHHATGPQPTTVQAADESVDSSVTSAPGAADL